MVYFKGVEEESPEGVGVEGLQSFVEEGVGQELILQVFDVDAFGVLAVDRPDLVAGQGLHLAHVAHLHLDEFSALLAVLLLGLLLADGLAGVALHADEVVEHAVGGLEHVLDAFVVDAHRGEEEF
jgi:hypothetical protein